MAPLPPTDMMVMPLALQQQFTMMQIVPILLTLSFGLWVANKHRTLVPIWLILSGGVAYLIEPIMTVVGLIWYPPQGMVSVFGAMGRPVPLFGFLAYAWFLGGVTVFVFDRVSKGMTVRQIMILYAILVVVEAGLEIPGLHMNVFQYYGNQPFVFMKLPLIFPCMNGAVPIVAGSLAWKLLPYVRPVLRPLMIHLVAVVNAMVMSGAGFVSYFALNNSAGTVLVHVAGSVTIATAACIVYGAALLVATDSRPFIRRAAAA
ncbi:hypothetical protein BH10PSE12_BH10PSE12_13500 [soil metagenome]